MTATGSSKLRRFRLGLGPVAGAMWDVMMAALLWVAWQFPIYAFLEMPPRLAMFWLVTVAVLFLWCHAAADGWSTAAGRATARVRPLPRATIPWLALLAPVMSTGALAMWMVLTSLRLARDSSLPRQIVEYGQRPGGTLVLVVLIAGLAPLIEEFVFRGWIQRPLERRVGPAWAIGLTAVLFALAHFEPGGIPIRIAGGMALGYAVWATRSIWTGVALHVAWNAGVLAFGGIFPHFDPARRGPHIAVPAGLALLASAAVFAWAAPRLRGAARRPPAAAHPHLPTLAGGPFPRRRTPDE